MTIDDTLERFLLQLAADGRSVHTVGQYRRHLRLLGRWARDVGHHGDQVEALDHEAVARFLADTAARTRPDGAAKKATSVNCLRSSLRGFFSYCHRAGFLAQDPTRLLRRARCGVPPPRALSKDEEERLLATLAAAAGEEAKRDHAIIHLMLATGLRVGSVVALDLEDVDLEQGELAVRRTKGDRPERVYLGQAIKDHLREYLKGRTSGPVFTTRQGERLNTRQVGRRFAAWVKKAGLRTAASPQTMRHTFATGLYQKTGDVLLVKAALRHRSIVSTLVYARPDEERLRRALA